MGVYGQEGAENPAFDQIKGILYATDDAEVEDDVLWLPAGVNRCETHANANQRNM